MDGPAEPEIFMSSAYSSLVGIVDLGSNWEHTKWNNLIYNNKVIIILELTSWETPTNISFKLVGMILEK